MELRFSKVREVKSPQRGTSKSAGIDFFIPEHTFYNTSNKLYPGEDILIPSGIKANIPEGYMLMAAEKSGVATSIQACKAIGRQPKAMAFSSPTVLGAKIVDEDYQGEIHIHIINPGCKTIELYPGMKIAQFILVPVAYAELVEVPEAELFDSVSQRGEGGFGSTGA